jgi:hypothetical protein
VDQPSSPASVSHNLPPAALIIRRKRVTAEEQLVLTAMLEVGDSTGGYLHIRVPRIAAHACVSERTVQRVLWGRKPPGRRQVHVRGKRDAPAPTPESLVGRGVVQELAPANTSKRRSTTFAIHAEVLHDDPKKCGYYEQRQLHFEATDQEVLRWCNTHRAQMEQIRTALDRYAQTRTNADPFSLRAAQKLAIDTSRRHGMPYRIAQRVMKEML